MGVTFLSEKLLSSLEERKNKEQEASAGDSDKDLNAETAAIFKTEKASEPSAEETEAVASHDQSRQPAGQRSNKNKKNEFPHGEKILVKHNCSAKVQKKRIPNLMEKNAQKKSRLTLNRLSLCAPSRT